MDRLPFRQVHLDFHTSECMPGVGSEFSEENFKDALIRGHISSISLFSKCHHGWSYHPTKVNKVHPTLNTDLLSRQLAVCEELGVRTQIYISAGLDERKANEYPQFCVHRLGEHNTLLYPEFHFVCLNNDEYIEMLKNEALEVLELYKGRFDGLFFDICWPHACVCASCIKTMMDLGLDPQNPADVEKHRKIVYLKYTKILNDAIKEVAPDMPVFYNFGDLPRNNRDVVNANTHHLELESLPTGGYGYDAFPISAAYARAIGREFAGMTGKFHKSWGEFGGFKHPNALKYEAGLSLAVGAKCNVGDQLHPLGCCEKSTYDLIGSAFAEVEAKEAWCGNVTAVTDIAIYSTEDFVGWHDPDTFDCPDIGANRIMLQGKYLYNVIDCESSFDGYKLIIFPDRVVFDEALTAKVNEFLARGGKILLTGKSGLCENGKFFADFGVEYKGASEFKDTFLVPDYEMSPNGITAYLMYEKGYVTEIDSKVNVLAYMQNSYFNRSLRRFCSHRITPNNPESRLPGAVINGNIGYIAWEIFTEYRKHGTLHSKQIVCDVLDSLLGDEKTMETTLPSGGVATLMEQCGENRLVNHLLYAVTTKRGDTEIIEDAIKITDTKVSIKLENKPKRVYLAPQMTDLDYTFENGKLTYNVDEFSLHQMVVIDK